MAPVLPGEIECPASAASRAFVAMCPYSCRPVPGPSTLLGPEQRMLQLSAERSTSIATVTAGGPTVVDATWTKQLMSLMRRPRSVRCGAPCTMSAGLEICISNSSCALFANPPTAPAPPPKPVTLSEGMQSASCVTNPDWYGLAVPHAHRPPPTAHRARQASHLPSRRSPRPRDRRG